MDRKDLANWTNSRLVAVMATQCRYVQCETIASTAATIIGVYQLKVKK
jgi:hypothetical protein